MAAMGRELDEEKAWPINGRRTIKKVFINEFSVFCFAKRRRRWTEWLLEDACWSVAMAGGDSRQKLHCIHHGMNFTNVDTKENLKSLSKARRNCFTDLDEFCLRSRVWSCCWEGRSCSFILASSAALMWLTVSGPTLPVEIILVEWISDWVIMRIGERLEEIAPP